MNKVLLIITALILFTSQQCFAAYCNVCCTDESATLFCTSTTQEDVCTGGCACCNLANGEVIYEVNDDTQDCCNGTPYKNGADTQDCCETGQGKTVVSVVGGTVNGLQACCTTGQTAYWNGSSVQCCDGNASCITHEGQEVCRCCNQGETLYAYYPNYEAWLNIDENSYDIDEGEAVVGCCANNPTTDYKEVDYDGDMTWRKSYSLCCSGSTPVYSISRKTYLYDSWIYGCFSKKTSLTSCWTEEPGSTTIEECKNDVWSEQYYSVCQNYYGDCEIVKIYPKDDEEWDENKHCGVSDCVVWECSCN